jgi:hypothetical protein
MSKTLFLSPPSFDGYDGGAGARKSVKAVLTVKEQKKTVLLERKDGVQEHYHVCDNDPKYAGDFGIPTDTTWA